jgi:MYXO-CTERM domain-containing protein
MRHFVFALMAGLILSGCGGPTAHENIGQSQAAIIDGVEATHPLVGFLDTPLGSCTATLIRPYTALTAAHCVARMGEVVPVPGMIYFYLDGEPHPTHSAGVTVHPDFANNKGKDLTVAEAYVEADLAVVSFEHEVKPGFEVPLAGEEPQEGQPVEIWGFGRSNDGTSGVSRRADGEVSEVYDTFYLMFAYEEGQGHFASGDSGGPTFDAGGTLIGVHSGTLVGEFTFDGSPPRKATGRETKDIRVDAFSSWIEQQLAEEPLCEGGECAAEDEECGEWDWDCWAPPEEECPEWDWDCWGKFDRAGGGTVEPGACSVAPGASSSPGWVLLLGLMAALVLWRRRPGRQR